jgi:hypothetical protein
MKLRLDLHQRRISEPTDTQQRNEALNAVLYSVNQHSSGRDILLRR